VRLLLDTHTFLWFVVDDPALSSRAKALLEDSTNDLLLSYASAWEMAIKISLDKLHVSSPFEKFLSDQLHQNGIDLLPFSIPQVTAVASMPFHHRDPFDRLLAAQVLTEKIPLVSKDAIFDRYGVQRLW
jgi:PIN domain nuclease of toxin-antitoxin system